MERRRSLKLTEKLMLAEKSSNIIVNKVKSGFTGSITFHFLEGQVMNKDDYETNKFYDIIEKLKIK